MSGIPAQTYIQAVSAIDSSSYPCYSWNILTKLAKDRQSTVMPFIFVTFRYIPTSTVFDRRPKHHRSSTPLVDHSQYCILIDTHIIFFRSTFLILFSLVRFTNRCRRQDLCSRHVFPIHSLHYCNSLLATPEDTARPFYNEFFYNQDDALKLRPLTGLQRRSCGSAGYDQPWDRMHYACHFTALPYRGTLSL